MIGHAGAGLTSAAQVCRVTCRGRAGGGGGTGSGEVCFSLRGSSPYLRSPTSLPLLLMVMVLVTVEMVAVVIVTVEVVVVNLWWW